MIKPTMLLIPKARVPYGSANDYACGVYEGNKNFSCTPYGDRGNIDQNQSSGSSGQDWAIGLVSTVIGAIVTKGITVVIAT